jgi:hypothetical protein
MRQPVDGPRCINLGILPELLPGIRRTEAGLPSARLQALASRLRVASETLPLLACGRRS